MAEKLSWTELRKAVATRAGVSEKKAGAFLSALQAQLVEALKTEKQVKINGLGTFRVQAVAPRKSVNVQTGEEIIIEGYNKLAFTPEAGVKELIESNQHSAVSSQFSENDPIQKLGAQAEEIVDILGELGQSPVKEESLETKVESLEDAALQDGAEAPTEPEKPVVPEPEPEPVKEPEPVFVPQPEPVFVREPEPIIVHEPKKKKKSHFVRNLFIILLILLVLVIAGYFFLRQELTNIIRSYIKPAQTEQVEEQPQQEPEAVQDTIVDETAAQKELIPKGALSQDQILAEFLAASEEIDMPEESKYAKLITTEAIHEGSRLTWMSKRFYGKKVYWPYLYDANRDVIINPNNIEVGTPIRVPKLTKAQLDTTSVAFEQLRQEAEAACRR